MVQILTGSFSHRALLALMLVVVAARWAYVRDPWRLCSRSLAALGRKVAQTRAGRRSARNAPNAGIAGIAPIAPKDRIGSKPSPNFFKRYVYIHSYIS